MGTNQYEHDMMTSRSHDEVERQNNIKWFRQSLLKNLAAGSRELFYRKVKPEYEEKHSTPLNDYREIRKEMLNHSYMKFQMGFHRVVQELMYETLVPAVEKQLPELIKKAQNIDHNSSKLCLDQSLVLPSYVSAVDIHCQPGGFTADHCEGDVAAGAIYDRSIHMYNSNSAGLTDMAGRTIVDYIDHTFPSHNVERILDMGCTIGHSTAAFFKRWPDADLQAIDVGASILRYAHARANALGFKINFSQQSAEHTNFENGSFDLITSNILAHETSNKAWPNIIKECHRLLKKGGIMIHAELPQLNEIDPYRQFIYTNETYYNNEPFWTKFRTLDLEKIAITAGFKPINIIRDFSKVKGYRDKKKINAAIKNSRSLSHGAPAGSPLGTAFIIGIKE
ncbi:MAG: methyltransferase type 12 [Rhodospirillaceae bacterium]|nr:methyltransferase type 12 [Rhodospirillaceae bacterium]